MQLKSFALFAAIAGLVAASPAPTAEAAVDATFEKMFNDLDKRACPYPHHGACVQSQAIACAIGCPPSRRRPLACRLECPQKAYQLCDALGC